MVEKSLQFNVIVANLTNYWDFLLRAPNAEGMAVHVAVGHAKLNLLLKDQELVQSKRNQVIAARPNKIAIGETCPICEQAITKQHARTHVVWHFIEELREIVNSFPNRNVSKIIINALENPL